MIKKLFLTTLSCLSAALVICSCSKPAASSSVPAPPPVSGDDSGTGTGDDNSGAQGGSSDWDAGTHCADIGQTPIILAYFTENSKEMPDATLLTHINYAHGRFADPTNGSGGIVVSESSQAPLAKVVALKSVNPKLKVMLMIGGWGMKADGFSMMARDGSKRTEFCQSVKSVIEKYGLDGVDIDWEYPTQSAEGTGADASDTRNFNLVLKELRETLGTDKIISFASSSSANYVDWGTAMKYLDYVNVMTYDMGAAPNGHNSPLHKSARFNHRSWDESISAHVSGGVPKDRQVAGVPFYGKAEKNSDIFDYEVKYNEMDEILNKGTYKGASVAVNRVWEPTSMVPFLTDASGKNVLSYDDPESVTAKGEYVVANGLLGAMFWEYRHDSSDHALLHALVRAVYGKETVTE